MSSPAATSPSPIPTFRVSTFNGTTPHSTGVASSVRELPLEGLSRIIMQTGWSPATFHPIQFVSEGGMKRTGMRRTKDNFEQTQLLVLDVDSGCSLAEATFHFAKYSHLIATTRSHLKDKGGVSCHRFRVILPLDKPITSDAAYTATWHEAFKLWPFIDPACKDSSRFYFPCVSLESSRFDGKAFAVSEAPLHAPAPTASVAVNAPGELKGTLSRATKDFILEGALPGKWHMALYKSAIDLKQNLYTEEEAIEKLSVVHSLDESHDIPLVADVYANREPRHPPRIDDDVIAFAEAQAEASLVSPASSYFDGMAASLNDPLQTRGIPTPLPELDKLLGGGKRLGELTVTCALAKSGKSSLFAYLMHHSLKKGEPVGYASREMEPGSEVLPNLLTIALGRNIVREASEAGSFPKEREEEARQAMAGWKLYFAKGTGEITLDSLASWIDELTPKGVRLFYIDHMHACLPPMEQWELGGAFVRGLRDIARSRRVHIDLIVQPGKVEGKLTLNSLRGGAAINQALDNLFLFERMPTNHISKLTLERARSCLAKPGHMFLLYNWETRSFSETHYDENNNEHLVPKRDIPQIQRNYIASRTKPPLSLA